MTRFPLWSKRAKSRTFLEGIRCSLTGCWMWRNGLHPLWWLQPRPPWAEESDLEGPADTWATLLDHRLVSRGHPRPLVASILESSRSPQKNRQTSHTLTGPPRHRPDPAGRPPGGGTTASPGQGSAIQAGRVLPVEPTSIVSRRVPGPSRDGADMSAASASPPLTALVVTRLTTRFQEIPAVDVSVDVFVDVHSPTWRP